MLLPRYDGHFLICQSIEKELNISNEFNKIEFEQWLIFYHKKLPIIKIYDPMERLIGYALGTILPQTDNHKIPLTILSEEPFISFKLIEKYDGSFLIFGLASNGSFNLILDAGGTFPAVYGDTGSWASSSPFLSPQNLKNESTKFRDEHYTTKELNSGAWYPFGMTAFKNIRRLLPNHQLDVMTGSIDRIWPIQSPIRTECPEDTIQEIASYLANLCKRIPGKINLPLTAGKDSRLLLAALLAANRNITSFTMLNNVTSIEEYTAPHVAKIAKIPHKLVKYIKRPQAEIDDWFLQTGYSAGGALVQLKRTPDTFIEDAFELDGVGGETNRRLYDLESDIHTRLTLSALMSRMGLKFSQEMKDIAQEWLDQTEHLDSFTVIKLLYVENRVSTFAYPQIHGRSYNIQKVISPYSQFKYIDLCLKLPPSIILSQKLPEQLINILQPKLLSIPFNKGTISQNFLIKVYRAMDLGYLTLKLKQYYGKLLHKNR